MEWAEEKVGDEVQTEGGRGQGMEGPEGHEKGAEFHSQMSLPGHVLPPPVVI